MCLDLVLDSGVVLGFECYLVCVSVNHIFQVMNYKVCFFWVHECVYVFWVFKSYDAV